MRAASPSGHAGMYLAVLLLPVFVLCGLLWVASTQWFMKHNGYPGLRGLGYELTLNHEDCEVVLYGDSSALTGYDPAIVQRLTGRKTCNVSEGGTILGVAGSYPLDTYLSRNKRPKYLVMMFTPSVFHPSPLVGGEEPEGYTYVLRFFRGRQLYFFLLRRPMKALGFASWVGQRLIADAFERLQGRHPDDSEDAGTFRREHHGLLTFPLPAQTECVRTALHYRAAEVRGDAEGVAAVRRKYERAGTRVFINVAPVPACDELQDTYERALAGEHDNRFERLPIAWFNSDDVHFNSAGASYLSTEVAQQILAAGDGK